MYIPIPAQTRSTVDLPATSFLKIVVNKTGRQMAEAEDRPVHKRNKKRPLVGENPCGVCQDIHPMTKMLDPLNTRVKRMAIILHKKMPMGSTDFIQWGGARLCMRATCLKTYNEEHKVCAPCLVQFPSMRAAHLLRIGCDVRSVRPAQCSVQR